MLSSAAIAPIFSAMAVAWASLSITQGPAIRNRGALGPKLMLATLKLVAGGMCWRMVAGTDYAGTRGISTLNCWREERSPERSGECRGRQRQNCHTGTETQSEERSKRRQRSGCGIRSCFRNLSAWDYDEAGERIHDIA